MCIFSIRPKNRNPFSDVILEFGGGKVAWDAPKRSVQIQVVAKAKVLEK